MPNNNHDNNDYTYYIIFVICIIVFVYIIFAKTYIIEGLTNMFESVILPDKCYEYLIISRNNLYFLYTPKRLLDNYFNPLKFNSIEEVKNYLHVNCSAKDNFDKLIIIDLSQNHKKDKKDEKDEKDNIDDVSYNYDHSCNRSVSSELGGKDICNFYKHPISGSPGSSALLNSSNSDIDTDVNRFLKSESTRDLSNNSDYLVEQCIINKIIDEDINLLHVNNIEKQTENIKKLYDNNGEYNNINPDWLDFINQIK